MISKQDVINNALIAFGNDNFVSGTVDIIDDIYNLNAQTLLAMEYWNFAQKVTYLGLISDDYELQPYKYKHYRPADAANIYRLFYKTYTIRDYNILGQFIYSNQKDIQCQYTCGEPPEAYPAEFADCLSYKIAISLCVAYGSSNSQPNLERMYQNKLSEARAVNGKDIPSILYYNDWYTAARY